MVWSSNFVARQANTNITMATINLLPDRILKQRQVDARNYYTLVGGMVVVIGTVVVAGFLLLFDQVYRVELSNLTTQKVQVEAQAAQYLDVEKKGEALSKQLTSLKTAENQTTHWTNLLTTLQTVTPPGVSVDAFSVADASNKQAAKTTIAGKADSRRSVAEFQIALAGSPYVKSAEIETTGQQGTVINYSIALEINYDKLNGAGK